LCGFCCLFGGLKKTKQNKLKKQKKKTMILFCNFFSNGKKKTKPKKMTQFEVGSLGDKNQKKNQQNKTKNMTKKNMIFVGCCQFFFDKSLV
jgi:hypothetical protein